MRPDDAMISVLILTKNEARDLPGCLASVAWSNDVHVFDSLSTDATAAIATAAGAVFTQRPFDGYARQRNAALTGLPFKNEWLLILDADERVPEALATEMQQVAAASPPQVGGYRIRRRDYLEGRWLRYSQITPYYVRLVRVGRARYHRKINEVIEVEGQVGQLKGYLEHYPFSKGYAHWLSKHNQYSTMEAQRWLQEHQEQMQFSLRMALTSPDPAQRRYHQKGLFYKLPGRPLLKWGYMVFARRGLLDGRPGLIYATLQAIYEYFIVLKTRELLREKGEKPASLPS